MADDIWTVARILEWIEGYLERHADEHPRSSAQWLVAEALGVSRMQLFVDLQRPLSMDERAILRDYTRRRGAGEPLQYITGTVDFRHITVKVKSGVLIPRPETEVLVSEALALLPAAEKPQDVMDAELVRQYQALLEAAGEDAFDSGQGADEPLRGDPSPSAQDDKWDESFAPDDERDETPQSEDGQDLLVADICTGSGCIACSIAHEHPRTRVFATDIAPQAVELARENVSILNLEDRVQVVECDLGNGIPAEFMGSLDLVVSNPPYVPTAVLADIPREVAEHEPALALDGGEDGLDVFRRLLAWCDEALTPGGAFAFELHETCLDAAVAEARAAGFIDVRITCDLASKPRILTARKA